MEWKKITKAFKKMENVQREHGRCKKNTKQPIKSSQSLETPNIHYPHRTNVFKSPRRFLTFIATKPTTYKNTVPRPTASAGRRKGPIDLKSNTEVLRLCIFTAALLQAALTRHKAPVWMRSLVQPQEKSSDARPPPEQSLLFEREARRLDAASPSLSASKPPK